MGIAWQKEIMKARKQSGSFQDSYEFTRAWLIRTNDAGTPLPEITNAVNIPWLDPHPDNDTCKAIEFETTPVDDSGLLYLYTVKYRRPPVNAQSDDSSGETGSINGLMKLPVWGGSSSSKTVPATTDVNDNAIANSAGEPLEDITKEMSEPRLSRTEYWLSHVDVLSRQRMYTDTVNNGPWNGGAERTWKCLGCSFQLQSENNGSFTFVYWEVTWEFAYDRTTWNLKPWDIGFAQRVNANGEPSGTGTQKAAIVGQDKRPVKSPVALVNGIAKQAGEPPDVCNGGEGFEVYPKMDFLSAFGEVYTPPVL